MRWKRIPFPQVTLPSIYPYTSYSFFLLLIPFQPLISPHQSSQTAQPRNHHLQSPRSPPHHPPLSTSSRNIIRAPSGIRNRARKAEEAVEQIGRRLVAGTSSLDLRLGVLARRLRCVVGLAHVGQLVAERVGDDVGVEGFALAAARQRVRNLECEFCGGPVAFAALEGDGGCAEAEVCACEGAGGGLLVAVVVCDFLVGGGVLLGVLVVVGNVVAGVGYVLSSGSLLLLLVVVGLLVVVVIVVIVGLLVVVVVSSSRSGTTSSSLRNNKVTETSLVEQIKDAQTRSIKRIGSAARAKSCNCTSYIDVGVDERRDATELRGDGKSGVTADILHVTVGEGVGVLLSGNEANGSSKGIGASSKFSEDLVSTDELLYELVFFINPL